MGSKAVLIASDCSRGFVLARVAAAWLQVFTAEDSSSSSSPASATAVPMAAEGECPALAARSPLIWGSLGGDCPGGQAGLCWGLAERRL